MKKRSILLAATMVAAAASAAVAQAVATYDPAQVPATRGQVAQYSLTPRGDVDGVILQDGTQVHLPPHLGPHLVQAVKPGDHVTVHGLKARALPLIQALSIEDEISGQMVVDSGPPSAPPGAPGAPRWQQVEGRVREPLYGPRGDMNGVLLEDGTQVHVPPDQAASLSQQLRAGLTLMAMGYGVTGPYGHSLEARKIGPNTEHLVDVASPGPPPGPPPDPPGAPPPAP